MRKLFRILVLLCVITCPVFAGPITDLGLYGTGYSSNWLVNGAAATTVTTIPGGWAANTSTSSWISTQALPGTIVDGAAAASPYDYTFQFTVPSTYNYATIVITGRWAMDNSGIGSVGGVQFSNTFGYIESEFLSNTFTISGLTSATNTLNFAVTNTWYKAGEPNPTGVQVLFNPTFTGGDLAGIPEPGTLVLLGGGLLALGFFRRRR